MTPEWAGPALGFGAGLVAGGLIGYAYSRRLLSRSEAAMRTREASWEQQVALLEQREQLRQSLQEQLGDRFAALSTQALEKNSESFLRLAQERFRQLQLQAGGDLQQRQQAIASLLQPLREALQKTERQIHEIEKERNQAYGSLSQHLQSMAEAQQRLQAETQSLVTALRRPEVRGQWGELTLRRLIELAGMVAHCDFALQSSVGGEDGTLRPDLVVRLPERRELVVDAKTPLDAYLSAAQARDDGERDRYLEQHARNLARRVRELAAKHYWAQFRNAPEFVVLFIPGEQFLSAALERRPQLQEEALQAKVILATPHSFVALLKTVAFGWRQQAVAENAEQIRLLGEQLLQRIATFVDHLARLGRSLGAGVEQYNRALGSLERQLLPAARRLSELGISAQKAVAEPEPLTQSARQPARDGQSAGGDGAASG